MRWIFASIVLLFGLITIDGESWKWNLLGIFLFAIPLLFQFVRSKEIRSWALWGGFFLNLQSLLSPIILNHDFKMLSSDMRELVDVRAKIPCAWRDLR